jgi:hypothetical protein
VAVSFVYTWRCRLYTRGGVVCLHVAVSFVYTWRCRLSTRGGVVCLHVAVSFVYTWRCRLSTRGGVVCLHVTVSFVYTWRCRLSTRGGVVCLHVAVSFNVYTFLSHRESSRSFVRSCLDLLLSDSEIVSPFACATWSSSSSSAWFRVFGLVPFSSTRAINTCY